MLYMNSNLAKKTPVISTIPIPFIGKMAPPLRRYGWSNKMAKYLYLSKNAHGFGFRRATSSFTYQLRGWFLCFSAVDLRYTVEIHEYVIIVEFLL